MKISKFQIEQPAVKIEMTAIEAEILMDVMGSISGSGPRHVTSEIYNGLAKLGYDTHSASVIDYAGERWRSEGTIKWRKVY